MQRPIRIKKSALSWIPLWRLLRDVTFLMKPSPWQIAIYLTGSKNDETKAKVEKFLQDGCGCSHGKKGSQCCQQFSKEAVLSNLNNCLELSHGELDLVVLANIQACTKIKITGEKRKRSSRYSFLYINRPICKDMFIHTLWRQLLTVLQHHEEHGVAQRVHGNCKKLPHNALPQAMSADIRNFLTNYVEESAILLPGRIPGFKKDDIRLLSSSETKMNVWRAFKRACKETGKQAVCFTTFTKLWQQFHPMLSPSQWPTCV